MVLETHREPTTLTPIHIQYETRGSLGDRIKTQTYQVRAQTQITRLLSTRTEEHIQTDVACLDALKDQHLFMVITDGRPPNW